MSVPAPAVCATSHEPGEPHPTVEPSQPSGPAGAPSDSPHPLWRRSNGQCRTPEQPLSVGGLAGVLRFLRRYLNFFRIHVVVFMLAPLVASAAFYAANRDVHVAYIDSLFLCVSALTVTGLTTINISQATGFQQSILYALMWCGNITTVACVMVIVRRYYFRKRFEQLVRHHPKTRRRAREIQQRVYQQQQTHIERVQQFLHWPHHSASSKHSSTALKTVAKESDRSLSNPETIAMEDISTCGPGADRFQGASPAWPTAAGCAARVRSQHQNRGNGSKRSWSWYRLRRTILPSGVVQRSHLLPDIRLAGADYSDRCIGEGTKNLAPDLITTASEIRDRDLKLGALWADDHSHGRAPPWNRSVPHPDTPWSTCRVSTLENMSRLQQPIAARSDGKSASLQIIHPCGAATDVCHTSASGSASSHSHKVGGKGGRLQSSGQRSTLAAFREGAILQARREQERLRQHRQQVRSPFKATQNPKPILACIDGEDQGSAGDVASQHKMGAKDVSHLSLPASAPHPDELSAAVDEIEGTGTKATRTPAIEFADDTQNALEPDLGRSSLPMPGLNGGVHLGRVELHGNISTARSYSGPLLEENPIRTLQAERSWGAREDVGAHARSGHYSSCGAAFPNLERTNTMLDTMQTGLGGWPTPFDLVMHLYRWLWPSHSEPIPRFNTITSSRSHGWGDGPEGQRAYLSFDVLVSRNSHFHHLSDTQREELGGVEYRALDLLSKLIPAYLAGMNLIGLTIIAPYAASRAFRDHLPAFESQGQYAPNRTWWVAFNTISAYSNTGMSLLDTSFQDLQDAYLPMTAVAFLILMGNTAFVRLKLAALPAY